MTLSTKRIFVALLALFLAFALFALVTTGSLGALILIPLGVVIGPYMGLTFPFPMAFKIGYAATLLVSLLLVAYGFRHRQQASGQAAIVTGVVLWALFGLIGLGTGT